MVAGGVGGAVVAGSDRGAGRDRGAVAAVAAVVDVRGRRGAPEDGPPLAVHHGPLGRDERGEGREGRREEEGR